MRLNFSLTNSRLSVYRFRAPPPGQVDAALDEFKRARDQDPQHANVASSIAETRVLLRNWKEAERNGEAGPFHRPARCCRNACAAAKLAQSDWQRGKSLCVLLASLPPNDLAIPNTGTYDMVIGTRAETFVLARDFNSASKAWDTDVSATIPESKGLRSKQPSMFSRETVPAYKRKRRRRENSLESRVREHPQDISFIRALGWVYLALNRKTDAINVAQQALELLPPERDAFLGADNLASLARCRRKLALPPKRWVT